jgi:hypothetical protein
MSERSNYDSTYIENRDKKYSNTLSDRRSEFKNVLLKSDQQCTSEERSRDQFESDERVDAVIDDLASDRERQSANEGDPQCDSHWSQATVSWAARADEVPPSPAAPWVTTEAR